ncbi:hypothetical protein V1L52_01085 [Treponema sp. HNW]|uniref:hypothetical protein n=1 Tax=Treponema sp. HNW TaxID=3116654 RepID=UPI003D0FC7B1
MNVIFPRAFAFAVDDLGWNYGSNIHLQTKRGPFRLGVERKMKLDDYKVLVQVGKSVGVRIQGLFVLCEMDRENICAKYPTTTMFGTKWNNTKNVNDEQIEIMNYVKKQAAYLEFGLHGVGHEYWDAEGHLKRSEWYDIESHKPIPEREIINHIACFKEIMAQYGLTKKNGHSFPRSFVPCAYSYWWNPYNKLSLGKFLSEQGVKYANTDFDAIRELNPPQGNNGGGFDHGVHVINRINYGNEWPAFASLPTIPLKKQQSDIIESHWANWLTEDSSLQKELIHSFIDYYNAVGQSEDRYPAKNTEQLHSQWLYKKYTHIDQTQTEYLSIDNRAMPFEAYTNNMLGNMVLKIPLKKGMHICTASINNMPIAAYLEQYGAAFLYLPRLERKKYVLKYCISSNKMPFYIINDGTYTVYSVMSAEKKTVIALMMYGTQTLKIKCIKPKSIYVDTDGITILDQKYKKDCSILELQLKAHDIQGNSGNIILN